MGQVLKRYKLVKPFSSLNEELPCSRVVSFHQQKGVDTTDIVNKTRQTWTILRCQTQFLRYTHSHSNELGVTTDPAMRATHGPKRPKITALISSLKISKSSSSSSSCSGGSSSSSGSGSKIFILRGYHTDVFLSACISSPSIDNGPRHSRGRLSTEGLI